MTLTLEPLVVPQDGLPLIEPAFVPLRVDLIDPDPDNVRATPITEEQSDRLRSSIAAQGVLSPILVRPGPLPGRYRVVFGAQRLRAAQALNLVEIPAVVRDMTDAEAAAAQAAENIARTSMAPVDQWLAIRRLQEHGFSLVAAGEQLGLPATLTRRLDKLGAMAPAMIDTIRRAGMPSDSQLVTIASAPTEMQVAALNRTGPVGTNGFQWYVVAQACQQTRISERVAKFNPASSGLPFEVDLFADTPDEGFTTDVAGFIAAQEAWLKEHVEARRAAGERIELGRSDMGEPKLPAGWEHAIEPVRTKPDEEPPIYGKRSKKMTVLWVRQESFRLGTIGRMVIQEKPKAKGKDKDKGKDAGAANAEAVMTPPDRPRMTEAGRSLIAATKTQALQTSFAEAAATGKPRADVMLTLLLLALGGSNVQLRGGDRGVQAVPREWLGAALVDEHGLVRSDALTKAPGMAARLLSHLLVAPGPTTYTSSGPAADWIGRYIAAPLPRWDTAQVLAHASGQELREVAAAAGVKGSSVGALRKALEGAAPSWTPPGAAWDAPGLDTLEYVDAMEDLQAMAGDDPPDEGGAAPAAEPEADAS